MSVPVYGYVVNNKARVALERALGNPRKRVIGVEWESKSTIGFMTQGMGIADKPAMWIREAKGRSGTNQFGGAVRVGFGLAPGIAGTATYWFFDDPEVPKSHDCRVYRTRIVHGQRGWLGPTCPELCKHGFHGHSRSFTK